MFRFRVPRLLTLLYVHNPFYLISACLFVYGLKLLFRPGGGEVLFERGAVEYIEPWSLMFSLCGVTLLMAVTAVLIVRLGRVWEDARSLVLVLLLMFLAISVSFDEIITLASWEDTNAGDALKLLLFGLLFSLGASEGLVRGLRVRLPLGYRLPLYALLALFFAYPLWLSPEVVQVNIAQARWRVAGFPLAAGLISLTLLPAIRRGSSTIRSNGTPWTWPWFPWTVFGFLGGAVCFRAWSLAISFDLGRPQADFWDTSFGLYFLVPFLLAVLVLLLEIGIVENSPKLRRGVLWTAPLLLLVSYPWLGPWTSQSTHLRFAYLFVNSVGSPVFLTVLALMAFYAIACWRGLRDAEPGLAFALLAAVFIGPDAFSATHWTLQHRDLHAWPLVLLGVWRLTSGIRRRSSCDALIGSLALVLAIRWNASELQIWQFRSLSAAHLTLLSALVVGAAFRDRFAGHIRRLACLLLVLLPCSATFADYGDLLPGRAAMAAYCAGLGLIAFVYGRWLHEPLAVLSVAIDAALALLNLAAWGAPAVRRIEVSLAAKVLACGILCFLMAVLISALKGGLATRLHRRWLLTGPSAASSSPPPPES